MLKKKVTIPYLKKFHLSIEGKYRRDMTLMSYHMIRHHLNKMYYGCIKNRNNGEQNELLLSFQKI